VIPFFRYKSHVSIDRNLGLIRKWKAADAAASDGARLREGLLDQGNATSDAWADTAYRSKANEAFMEKQGFVSKIHRKKPPFQPMPPYIRRSNSGKSAIHFRIEHVFADQKVQIEPFIRTIGIK
jgi:IS5 family transposase